MKIGRYSFMVGVIIALVLGIASGVMGEPTKGILASFLVLLGIIVGFLNVILKANNFRTFVCFS